MGRQQKNGRIYVVGTCDTKFAELDFAVTTVRQAGGSAILVDVATRPHAFAADIPAAEVAGHHPQGAGAVFGPDDRGTAVGAMAKALTQFLSTRDDIGAVLGIGGTGNTALVTEAMRSLPIGVPKLMVSTIASGNTAPSIGATDMAMMYSVVDIAGLNPLSRRIIGNAARAAAGMARQLQEPERQGARPGIGMTMFGVTTPCVTAVRAALEVENDVYVFHATGTGGQSMEKLGESGFFDGIIDVTTTEVADFLFDGVFPCGPDRFGAVIRTGLPYVGSVGAVDMVNFGTRNSVPARHAGRKLHVHNAQVTLMRTTPEENRAIGAWIVERLNRMPGEVRFLLPLRGVSAIDAPGMPFHDPEADLALFEAIRAGWRGAPNRRLVEIDAHINDAAFAAELVVHFNAIRR